MIRHMDILAKITPEAQKLKKDIAWEKIYELADSNIREIMDTIT